jgi:hypothetical protein
MRTKTLLLTAALVAAGVASSMAQSNVYSVNIVGYVNVPVKAGVFYLLSNPFDKGNGNNIDGLFTISTNNPADDQGGTVLYVFDQVNGYGNGETFFSGANAWDPGTTTLAPGKGFFLQPAADGVVTFVGNVVLASTNTLPSGFSLVGSAYPASTNLSNLGIHGGSGGGDVLYRYFSNVGPSGGFGNGATSFGTDLWSDGDVAGGGPVTGPALNVAEGFFYDNEQGTSETVVQNFTVN